MSQNRTLICLAAKRSGTSATHRIFVAHPQVKVVHPDQNIRNIEPNFWNYAMAVLEDPDQITKNNITAHEQFVNQIGILAPHIVVPDTLTEDLIFDLWDQIAEHYGPICFDKSPRYLEDQRTLDLIYKYKESGRGDIRFFGIMRAPWDVISSQFELWEHIFPQGTPEWREQHWLMYYRNFEQVQARYNPENVPLFYYEQMADEPDIQIPRLLQHCGIDDIKQTYSHFRPVSIGRYYKTHNPTLMAWQPSEEFISYAHQHGYQILPAMQRYWIRFQLKFKGVKRFGQRVYYKLRLIARSLPVINTYLDETNSSKR